MRAVVSTVQGSVSWLSVVKISNLATYRYRPKRFAELTRQPSQNPIRTQIPVRTHASEFLELALTERLKKFWRIK
jgi:hypothetical protein